jgi:hypothetical protein
MPKDFQRRLPKSGTVKAIDVLELEKKFNEIAGALNYPKNKTAFADALKISRSTVNDAVERSACTPELLEQIWEGLKAQGFRFSPPPKLSGRSGLDRWRSRRPRIPRDQRATLLKASWIGFGGKPPTGSVAPALAPVTDLRPHHRARPPSLQGRRLG